MTTILHGRSEWDRPSVHGNAGNPHFVPEGWEELDRGICPGCGQTVAWREQDDGWEADDTLTVLVLTEQEMEHIRLVRLDSIGLMADLNRPYEEVTA